MREVRSGSSYLSQPDLRPLFGLGSVAYSVAAALCGAAILAASIVFRRERSNRNARRLFMMSNLYLIVVMVLLVL